MAQTHGNRRVYGAFLGGQIFFHFKTLTYRNFRNDEIGSILCPFALHNSTFNRFVRIFQTYVRGFLKGLQKKHYGRLKNITAAHYREIIYLFIIIYN
jgi:hypothetical protein